MPAPGVSTLIDWVDPADEPFNTIARGEVFEKHAAFRVVHIFLFDPAGDLLVQQLGHSRDRNPLKWGSSVAGYLNAGEDYLEAAKRRLKEELDYEGDLAKFGSVVMRDQGARKFITLYIGTAFSSRVAIAEPDHIERVRFAPLGDLIREIQEEPDSFTETFRFLLRFYLSNG